MRRVLLLATLGVVVILVLGGFFLFGVGFPVLGYPVADGAFVDP